MSLKKDGLIRIREATSNIEEKLSNILLELDREIETLNDDMKAIQDNKEDISQKMQEYNEQIQNYEKQIQNYEDEIHDLKNKLVGDHFKQSVIESEVNLLKKYNRELEEKNEQLQNRLMELPTSNNIERSLEIKKRIDSHKEEVEKLQQKLEAEQSKNQTLKSKNNLLKIIVEEVFNGKYHRIILQELLRNPNKSLKVESLVDSETSELEEGLIKRAIKELEARNFIEYDDKTEGVIKLQRIEGAKSSNKKPKT